MLIEAIKNLFSFQVLAALLAGNVIGIIFGALPGLSALMTVSLLLPFSFVLPPTAGLVLLMSLYTSAIYGGSITAILLHTPGTPASAATALDGYQMTKSGRGLKALGYSTVSSTIGGIMSAVALLFFTPLLSSIALKFGAAEYFLIAIFGMTIIASLSGKSLIKGLISGVFGIVVGSIGMDTMTGYSRFSFGNVYLEAGVSMVPALIGLFSISEILITCEQIAKGNVKRVHIDENLSLEGRMLPTWPEIKAQLGNIFRSGVIGTFVGILPGAGAEIGSWVSYNEAKKFSKHPERFGQGSEEGLCASEAANNAVTGGAMIPLLTLGIPGSGTCAVMLGALILHGLVPGRNLFTRYADTTYAIMLGFLLANITMCIVGLILAKRLVRITDVPIHVLTPAILLFSTIGAYAINSRYFDLLIMVAFGLIGYLMRKLNFQPAATVLGIILGPMAEGNLMEARAMAEAKYNGNLLQYFAGRKISLVLMILIVLALLWPVFSEIMSRRKEAKIVK